MRNKLLYRFAVPSVCSMLVMGLYFIVDGIFVGQGVGTNALAAVNISMPFISILTAVALMLTMGGATMMAICLSRGNREEANRYFNLSIAMHIVFSVVMSIISVLFSEEIAVLIGATDVLVQPTAEYLMYFVLFGVFYCGSSLLAAFLRNDNNPQLALWGMISGAVSNVFLDWLFIFPLDMGIKGAAIASGVGQIVSCLVMLMHFIKNKGELHLQVPKGSVSQMLQICKTGFPEFITHMSQPITIMCYNFVIIKAYGEIGVAAYSVITYILYVVFCVFTGLAQGIQPLLSRSYGAGEFEDERFYFHRGLFISVMLSVVMYAALLIFGKEIISVFNADPELIRIGYEGIAIYGVSYIFAAANVVLIIYFLSTKRTKNAVLVSFLRGFCFNILCIFLTPVIFGEKSIWSGMIVAEIAIFIIALILVKGKKEILLSN